MPGLLVVCFQQMYVPEDKELVALFTAVEPMPLTVLCT